MNPYAFFGQLLNILGYQGDRTAYVKTFFIICQREAEKLGNLDAVAQKYTNRFVAAIKPHLTKEQKIKLKAYLLETAPEYNNRS